MCEINLEQSDVWHEIRRKARKPKRCSCCHAMISPGEGYIDHFSLYEGDVTSERMCESCDSDRAEFVAAHGDTPTPSFFRECLEGCIDEHYEQSVRVWMPMLDRIRARGPSGRAPLL